MEPFQTPKATRCLEESAEAIATTDGELLEDQTVEEAIKHGMAMRIGDIIVGLVSPGGVPLKYHVRKAL